MSDAARAMFRAAKAAAGGGAPTAAKDAAARAKAAARAAAAAATTTPGDMPPPPPRLPAGLAPPAPPPPSAGPTPPPDAAFQPTSQATLALGATSDEVLPSPPTVSAVSTAHTGTGLPPGFFEGASGVPGASGRGQPARAVPPPPGFFEPPPAHGVSVEDSVPTRAGEEAPQPVNDTIHTGIVAYGSDSGESKEEKGGEDGEDGEEEGVPPPPPTAPPSTSLPADFYGQDQAPVAVAAAAAAAAAAADADLAALLAAATDDPATAAEAAAAQADADAAARAEAEEAEARAAKDRLARLRAGVVDAGALAALPGLDGAEGVAPPLVEGGQVEGGRAAKRRRVVPAGRPAGEVSSSSGSSDSESGGDDSDLAWRRKGV